MRTQSETNPTLSLLDRLEAKYRIREEFFEIKLPDGETLKFKNILTISERKRLRDAVKAFADKVESGKGIPEAWKKFLPIDRDVAESLAAIAFLSAEPKFTDLDVLRLHNLPGIADLISWQIQEAHARNNDFADLEEIEEAKKDSAPTPLSD
jgi:hypothetical protein